MNKRMEIIKELELTLAKVSDTECEAFLKFFDRKRRFFFAGAGRSGFAIRGFAMRMMHLGYTCFVLGEPTTPSIHKDDVLVIASGSGNTGSLVSMAEKAKAQEAKVMLVTIDLSSKIGKIADACIQVPAPSPKVQSKLSFESIQPMGSLAEQTAALIFDSLVLQLMERDKMTSDEMFKNHANME